jgi:hypothetical protein
MLGANMFGGIIGRKEGEKELDEENGEDESLE